MAATPSTNSLMLADMGLGAAKGLSGMLISANERKVQRIQDEYNNMMAAFSAAQSNNQITRNAASLHDQVVLSEAADQQATMQATEEARVAAAAAGVSGNSVATTLGAFVRSKAQRALARTREERAINTGLQDQRRQIATSLVYGKANTVMPSTVATDLLGLSANLLDTYKAYQPDT